MSLGRTSGGWWASDSYRPSIAAFVRDVGKARSDNRNSADTVPLPCGWSFDMGKSQRLIEPGVDEFPFYKACYGWVASINEDTCNDSASALCFHVIVNLPFRYGGSEAEPLGCAFARMNAFSAKCIFRWVSAAGNCFAFSQIPFRPRLTRASLANLSEAVTVGDAANGLLSPTDSDYKSANLLGRMATSFQEWRASSPQRFFEEGLQPDHDALLMLPLMGCKWLQTHRGHASQLLFQHDKQRAVAVEASPPSRGTPRAED